VSKTEPIWARARSMTSGHRHGTVLPRRGPYAAIERRQNATHQRTHTARSSVDWSQSEYRPGARKRLYVTLIRRYDDYVIAIGRDEYLLYSLH
jgi:hypothetical protein